MKVAILSAHTFRAGFNNPTYNLHMRPWLSAESLYSLGKHSKRMSGFARSDIILHLSQGNI